MDDYTTGLQDANAIRRRFPIFGRAQEIGRPLHYLDSAASAQKPDVVIECLSRYLSYEHANIHRGAYALSAHATERFDAARKKVAAFIKAPSVESIIFTRGTTESINLLAYSLSDWFQEGDRILLSMLEHHSNLVPWQMLAKRKKLRLIFADIDEHATLDLRDFAEKVRAHRPKLVAITHIANSFGSVTPVERIMEIARSVGAKVLLDAAQSSPHRPLDMGGLGCDFLAFSGHKTYGPTGVGVLACRPEMYGVMEPFHGGGDMINTVTLEESTWAEPPQKFEAGTPAIAEVIGLGETVDFLGSIGMETLAARERQLFSVAFEMVRNEPGVTVYGPATAPNAPEDAQSSIISFNVSGVHPHDLSTIADSFNVQIRSGHHCAMPALKRLGIPSSARASLGMYSTIEDFEALIEAVRKARRMFA